MRSKANPFTPFTVPDVLTLARKHETAMRRRLQAEFRKLWAVHAHDLEVAAQLMAKASAIDAHVVRIEDRVANRADRRFGGADAWRRNKRKLTIVANAMKLGAACPRAEQAKLMTRAAELTKPYLKGVEVLEAQFRKARALPKNAPTGVLPRSAYTAG